MQHEDLVKTSAKKWALGICTSGLALVLLFPPVYILFALVFADPNAYRTSDSFEGLVWCTPIIHGRTIFTKLWIAEIVTCLALSMALLLVAKKRRFRSDVAITLLVVTVLVSAVIPRQRVAYFGWGNRLDAAVVGHTTFIFEAELKKQMSIRDSLQSILFDAPHDQHLVNRFVFSTITSGLVAPAVLATWVLGLFVAGFAGLLTGGDASTSGSTEKAEPT